jgi:hypothetical protein
MKQLGVAPGRWSETQLGALELRLQAQVLALQQQVRRQAATVRDLQSWGRAEQALLHALMMRVADPDTFERDAVAELKRVQGRPSPALPLAERVDRDAAAHAREARYWQRCEAIERGQAAQS